MNKGRTASSFSYHSNKCQKPISLSKIVTMYSSLFDVPITKASMRLTVISLNCVIALNESDHLFYGVHFLLKMSPRDCLMN